MYKESQRTFHALHCPFPPPSLFVSFFTSSLTFSLNLGSVGFPLLDGIFLLAFQKALLLTTSSLNRLLRLLRQDKTRQV
jgi:hypothetical protein